MSLPLYPIYLPDVLLQVRLHILPGLSVWKRLSYIPDSYLNLQAGYLRNLPPDIPYRQNISSCSLPMPAPRKYIPHGKLLSCL